MPPNQIYINTYTYTTNIPFIDLASRLSEREDDFSMVVRWKRREFKESVGSFACEASTRKLGKARQSVLTPRFHP